MIFFNFSEICCSVTKKGGKSIKSSKIELPNALAAKTCYLALWGKWTQRNYYAFKKQTVVNSIKGVKILKFKKNIIRTLTSMRFQFKLISKTGNTVKCFSSMSFPFVSTTLLRKCGHFKYMPFVNRNRKCPHIDISLFLKLST